MAVKILSGLLLVRDGSSNALAQEQQLPHQGHSYSRLLSLGDEPGDALPLGRGGDPWEGRGSNNFHTSPFMSRMQASGMRSSMTGVETPHRLPVARGSWSSSDMPGKPSPRWALARLRASPIPPAISSKPCRIQTYQAQGWECRLQEWIEAFFDFPWKCMWSDGILF